MELTGPADDNDETEDAAGLFRVIGRQVRLLRERAGLTQRELGERLGYSEELIRSLERGRRTPQAEFLEAADELLVAGGLLRAAKEDVARAKARARVKHPAWFRSYAKLEAEPFLQDLGRMSTHQRTESADLAWFKSTHSSGEGGACIEGVVTERAMLVRDSKNVTLPHLSVSHTGWADFVRYAIEG